MISTFPSPVISAIAGGSLQINGRSPYYTPYGPLYPIVNDELPIDNAINQPLNPELSMYVYDYQHDSMSITFMTNASSSWDVLGSPQIGGNGTYIQATTVFDDYSTKYWWSVNCTDGIHWTNKTFILNTEPEPIRNVSDEPEPKIELEDNV